MMCALRGKSEACCMTGKLWAHALVRWVGIVPRDEKGGYVLKLVLQLSLSLVPPA